MSKFDFLIDCVSNLSEKEKINETKVSELTKKYSGIPEDYISFLKDIGFGNFDEFQMYSGPVEPDSIYPEQNCSELNNIILFGDDFQGYCFGFDMADNYRVVEVGPRGEVDREGDDNFIDFLKFYFEPEEE